MADELVARAAAISSRLQLVRDGRGGRLRVAAGAYIHDIAVQPAAIALIRNHPSVRLELLEREWTAVLRMLMTDEVDLAVFDIDPLRRMPALRIESLGPLAGTYFCRSGHPLLAKAVLQPADLRAYPFVMPGMSNLHRDMIDLDPGLTLDATSGTVLPSIAVSSFGNARDIVAETDAIGLGHASQLSTGIAQGRLAKLTLPWRAGPPTVEMGIAYKRERTLLPVARKFIGHVRRCMRAAA
ncbi:MAG: substrate-binding domain-containing protein [Pseudomonadota bacterium]